MIAEALDAGAAAGSASSACSGCSTATGSPVAEWRLAGDPVAAGEAAAELGGPVALKALGPEIVHKTDLGAIEAGLDGARDVAGAASLMDAALARAGLARERFLVQRMVEGGVGDDRRESSATRCSARSSPAGPAASRRRSSRTSACASRR